MLAERRCIAGLNILPRPPPFYGSLTVRSLQSVSAGLNVWDYLPDEFLMADAIQSEVDLDEAMVRIFFRGCLCIAATYSGVCMTL